MGVDLFISSCLHPATRAPPTVYLRRRHALEASGDLLLPWQAHLGVDLRRRLEVLDSLVQQTGAKDDAVGAERLLCVVDVGGAVLAVVAVDTLACSIFSTVFHVCCE